MIRPILLALVATGCTTEVVLKPVIDGPSNDADANAFSGLERIEMTIAREGDDVDIVSQSFDRGEALILPGATFGDDLVIHLAGFIGESQVAYGRTCAFAVSAADASVEPHVFFARTQKFAGTDLVPAARDGGRAVSFLGSGLFLGGSHASASTLQIERFDPLSGTLTEIASVSERRGAVEALIGIRPPRIALLGGQVGVQGADFFEVIDPNRPERPVDDYPDAHFARIGLTATTLTDGRVIAIGGAPPGSPLAPVGTITEVALTGASPDVRDLRAVLAHPRTGHTATRLGDDVGAPVLIAGGTNAAGAPVTIAELFKPLSEELANPLTFAPPMLVPRSRHAAALMPDGSVLIVGGIDAAGAPVHKLELFSLDAGFEDVGMLPMTAGVIDATITALPDGRILIAGGRVNANPGTPATNTAFIARLDPLDGSVDVVPTDRLGVARAGHQAATLCDGTILVTGGASDGAIAERYNPPDAGRR